MKNTAKGGGVFLCICYLMLYLLFNNQEMLNNINIFLYFLGPIIITLLGVIDDVCDVKPKYRLIFQTFCISWILYWMNSIDKLDLNIYMYIGIFVLCIWFLNAVNFIDGTNGMLSCATIYICSCLLFLLKMDFNNPKNIILIIMILSLLPFLPFNLNKANLFLGDSGSSFISYMLALLILDILSKDILYIWSILIIMAWYLSDTTITTTIRAIKYKANFYKGHRSHAYQNIARIYNSHNLVLIITLLINCLWIVPNLILINLYKEYSLIILIICYFPITLTILKYGPLYQDK